MNHWTGLPVSVVRGYPGEASEVNIQRGGQLRASNSPYMSTDKVYKLTFTIRYCTIT